jgi:hypothetical protein
MSEAFIHTCYVEGHWPLRDQYFVLSSLIGESLAVYYWCEWFMDKRRSQRLNFCVIGQRGLSEYVARITPKVIALITTKADDLKESWGYKFGLTVALRDALRARRDEEIKLPEYMDQCNASTYRAKKQMNHTYKVGVRDQPVEYDVDGFKRGKQQVWTLTQFKTPIQVLDLYARKL